VSLLAAVALSVLAGTTDGRRAVVVAFNDADTEALAPLRYADDDGVLWAEVLERLGYETQLLTVPDVDTARRGAAMLKRARPPTREAVLAAVERVRAANLEDRARGIPTDTLFVYVGHGEVDPAGRAYLTLLRDRLYRETLANEIVDRVEADFVHLIVDACHAAGVLSTRGGDPQVLARLGALLAMEGSRSRPTVGSAFAESDSGQTHEWSRLRAGIFSHVVRSALLGAADVNLDGAVEYSELEGFAAAALAGVTGAPAALHLRLSPPAQDPRRPLVTSVPHGPRLVLPADGGEARLTISDRDGTRLLELHRLPGQALVLHLPERSAYWIASPTAETRIGREELAQGVPPLVAVELSARGPGGEGLERGLFQVPFGRSFYEGFVAQAGRVPVDFRDVRIEGISHAPSRGWTGLELGLTAGQAPLGVLAVSAGPFLAFRTEGTLRFGGRVGYGVAPRAWIGGATLHRVAILATAGWEGPAALTPTAEVGAGLTLIGVTGATGPQADLTVPSARLAVGGRWRTGGWVLRAGLSLTSDFSEIDGLRRLAWLPSLDLGVER